MADKRKRAFSNFLVNRMAPTTALFDTEIPKETRRITWRVTNFQEMTTAKELFEACQISFEMGDDIGLPCMFTAHLVDGGSGYFGVTITLDNWPVDVTAVMMKWNELWAGNKQAAFGTTVPVVKPQDYKESPWGVPYDFFWTPDNGVKNNVRLEDDGSLLILFEVTLYNVDGIRSPTSLDALPSLMTRHQESFRQMLGLDMEKLQKEPIASAGAPEMVKLVSKEGKEFPVNWLILAARSPVFKTMFQAPMSEVKEGVVKLDDIGGDALTVFLHFLHTGILDEDWKDPGVVEDFAYAAHKYLLKDLLEFLDEALGYLCTQENCGMLFRLATRYELKKARKMVLVKCRVLWNQAMGFEEMKRLLETWP